MRKTYYTVQTRAGIKFHVLAATEHEAKLRAQSPTIGICLARLMQQAVADIASVEPHRGPDRLLKYPIFGDEIFFK